MHKNNFDSVVVTLKHCHVMLSVFAVCFARRSCGTLHCNLPHLRQTCVLWDLGRCGVQVQSAFIVMQVRGGLMVQLAMNTRRTGLL